MKNNIRKQIRKQIMNILQEAYEQGDVAVSRQLGRGAFSNFSNIDSETLPDYDSTSRRSQGDQQKKEIQKSSPVGNVQLVINALLDAGIDNENFIKGVLCVIQKETGDFTPRIERGYSKTSNERIKDVFKKTIIQCGDHTDKKLSDLNDDQINDLKSSNEKFFAIVYGGRNGNSCPVNDDWKNSDGWIYRGRGFIQITGKGNYKRDPTQDTGGYDFTGTPDDALDPKNAAYIASVFIRNASQYSKISSVKTIDDGINLAADIVAGRPDAKRARANSMKHKSRFENMEIKRSLN